MTDFETITVPAHLCGYPGVAFGGYVAGVLATRAAAKTVRVDFRRPVPTDAPVRLAPTAEGGVQLVDGELLLAAATPPIRPSRPPSRRPGSRRRRRPTPTGRLPRTGWSTASAAVCTARPPRACACTAAGCPAAPWWPPPGPPAPNSAARTDCCRPSWCGARWTARATRPGRLLDDRRAGAVTAALTARLLRPVPVGAGLVSYAWLLGSEGRKYRVGTALATAAGDLCAVGEALWVEPRVTT